MIRPEQCRAARGYLGWTQAQLAKFADVSALSIANFEKGLAGPNGRIGELLEAAFMRAELEFPNEHSVQKRTDNVQMLKGNDALRLLWDDIFFTLKDRNEEVLITHVDEKRTLEKEPQALVEQLKRLQEHKISERLLSCEGDTCYLMPKECYRWMPKELFTFGMSTYIYLDKVAFQIWQESTIILVQSREVARAEKERFEQIWAAAKIPL